MRARRFKGRFESLSLGSGHLGRETPTGEGVSASHFFLASYWMRRLGVGQKWVARPAKGRHAFDIRSVGAG